MSRRVKKYTVYLLTPLLTWEGVEATSKSEAVKECSSGYTPDGVHKFVAVEEDNG